MSDAPPHPSARITPETARSFLPGSFPGDLGIEPLEIEDTHSRGRIVVDKRHLHPGGFVRRAAESGFREAVRERDEPYGDHGLEGFGLD